MARYRRNTVDDNLRRSFPEKTARERQRIAHDFYAHLCDLLAESIKACAISKTEIKVRHRYTNIELLEKYRNEGRSVSILGAHYGNWEWVALSLPLFTGFQTHGIYQKLSNSFLDKALKRSRERYGMRLVATSEVSGVLRATSDRRITMGYIGDQSPSRKARHHWLRFLNQDTPTSFGYERFAREYDTPVLYLNIVKVRRGYYEGTFYPVTDHPRATEEGQIAEAFMRILEGIVRERPELWLWSHRRWKIEKPPASGPTNHGDA